MELNSINGIEEQFLHRIKESLKEYTSSISELLSPKESIFEIFDSDLSHYQRISYENKLNEQSKEISKLKKEKETLFEKIQKLKTKLVELSSLKLNNDTLIQLLSVIKGEVHEIRSAFFGEEKESKYMQTRINRAILQKCKLPVPIEKLNYEIHIENIHSNLYNKHPIKLKDNRIVGVYNDNSISITSINYETKKWKVDIQKENAHNDCIYSFCELNNGRLVSCSEDNTIKIWKISSQELILMKSITEHTDRVNKVISLDKNRFASCSDDYNVFIWNSEEPYSKIETLLHDDCIWNILKLNNKETIMSICYRCIHFWDLQKYEKINSIYGIYTFNSINSMIELPNQNIAVSTGSSSIIIIEPIQCIVVKEIKLNGNGIGCSSLCLFNDNSFVYICNGNFYQISNRDYSIMYKSYTEHELSGVKGILLGEGGKYLIVANQSNGFDVVKPC